jgi:hypothetical protein
VNLGTLKQIREHVSSQWEKGKFLRAEAAGDEIFPLAIPVKGPSASEITDHFDQVRNWINKIKTDCRKAGLPLDWREINHRQLGRNSIPAKIVFNALDTLADFINKKTQLQTFREALKGLVSILPELQVWAAKHPFALTGCASELEKLLSVILWMRDNPRPGIYIRQLSLPGVDTKFIEKNKKLLSAWFDIILPQSARDERVTGTRNFELRYGFLPRPDLVRFRILDPEMRISSLSDLSVPASEFTSLNPSFRRIFIIENDITALAFPGIPKSMLIFGRGYSFINISSAEWMKGKELWYWGDMDTHGFAILNQFREYFPQARSFLMDRDTLMFHEGHWGEEKKQSTADLSNLHRPEASLYDDLRYNKIGKNLRLEQEFIDFAYLNKTIQTLPIW